MWEQRASPPPSSFPGEMRDREEKDGTFYFPFATTASSETCRGFCNSYSHRSANVSEKNVTDIRCPFRGDQARIERRRAITRHVVRDTKRIGFLSDAFSPFFFFFFVARVESSANLIELLISPSLPPSLPAAWKRVPSRASAHVHVRVPFSSRGDCYPP